MKRSQKSEIRSRSGESRLPGTEHRAPDPQHSALSTQPLLLEIGCEEIPARFLSDAQKELGSRLSGALVDLRLAASGKPGVETYSTPRRLIAIAPRIFPSQADQVEETTGPPVKVAFDAAGKPTRAAESFAQKAGVRVVDLVRVTTPKGEYVAARKTVKGRGAVELLAEVLPRIIVEIPFPKSMYWTLKSGPRFSRPIRWLVALVGEGKDARVISFDIAGVISRDKTLGHRLAGAKTIAASAFGDFRQNLRAAQVEIDPDKRREMIRAASQALLEPSSQLVEDLDLEAWHVNSTEWPSAIAGSFEAKFLRLPREILITVMRDHQKYFAVEDSSGNLKHRFIAILNRDGDPNGVIRAGHERVLRARFTDAEFFWDTDQKIPLRDRAPLLERVTYHEKLGSYADKVRRMRAIAGEICAALEQQGKLTPAQKSAALRAIELSKCDLTTQMVKEFTELQGIVGGLYAQAQGERQEVAEAIYDHYRPAGFEDDCPRSVAGAIVSLADKLDSVVEGFRAGLAPTGSSDPFGLRRAGNGIVKILLDMSIRLDLAAHASSGDQKLFLALTEFFADREQYFLQAVLGFPYDTVRAALFTRDGQGWSDPLDAKHRVEALELLRNSDDMLAICAAAKRVTNILAKSVNSNDWRGVAVDESLLAEPEEIALHRDSLTAASEVAMLREQGSYAEALRRIAMLRPTVDRFFDKVLVMAEDPSIRQNRILVLREFKENFSGIADLSQIETTASTVGASTKKEVESDE